MTANSTLIQDWKMLANIQINSKFISTETVLSILDAFQKKWVISKGDSQNMNTFVDSAHQSFVFANSVERLKAIFIQGNKAMKENRAEIVKDMKFIEVFGINTQNLM